MTTYISDRLFTNYIHENLAIPKIYDKIQWQEHNIDPDELERMDLNQGIDYIFKDDNGDMKTVQERFRESKYQKYSDFTIRYRRDNNVHKERVESEYYKMNASYFTYGITNCIKTEDLSNCTDFIKYAVIDLEKVYPKIDDGSIIISDNNENFCKIIDDEKIECPVKYNKDGSSSFFPIDISLLVKLWGSEMIITEKGFL